MSLVCTTLSIMPSQRDSAKPCSGTNRCQTLSKPYQTLLVANDYHHHGLSQSLNSWTPSLCSDLVLRYHQRGWTGGNGSLTPKQETIAWKTSNNYISPFSHSTHLTHLTLPHNLTRFTFIWATILYTLGAVYLDYTLRNADPAPELLIPDRCSKSYKGHAKNLR